MYDRVAISQDPLSTSTKSRKNAGEVYGLVGTVPIPDPGVPIIIIQPRINVAIPNIPNLNINPRAINPNPNFTIPEVETITFQPVSVSAIKPNVFSPPKLDEPSIGFSQDSVGAGFYGDPNVLVNQSNAISAGNGSGTTTITINDRGFNVDNAFEWYAERGAASAGTDTNRGKVDGSWDYTESYRGTVTKANNINVTPSGYYSFYTARPTLSHYANPAYAPVSPQAVFNITMPSYTGGGGVIGLETGTSTKIKGNWKLYNNTETPFGRTEGPTAGNPHGRIHGNTLRFISLNATGIALGTATANTNVTGGGGVRIYPNVTFRLWASEMKNNGTINIKGIDSIGIDFAEFKFIRDADSPSYTNDFKRDAYDRKGSLNMYVKVGNINVESEDPSFGQPGNRGNESGSYGIRIPNVFHDSSKETQLTQTDTEGIYYDETII